MGGFPDLPVWENVLALARGRDAAAAHYAGTELLEVIASRPEARGYAVRPDGEVPLSTRLLTASE